MCTQILLDKESISEPIHVQFQGINYKDCMENSNAGNKSIKKEEAGPNYFLMGGPYKNYATR